MKSRIFLIIVMVLFASCIFAKEDSGKSGKELQIVRESLKDVMNKLGDEISVKNMSRENFEVRYHTRNFTVHSSSKIGQFSDDTSEWIGPDYDGFILKVYLQDAGIVNQLGTPQQIREPYWSTYLDVTLITGTKKQIYWCLSFWGRTDEKILSQIKETLWKLDKSPKKVPNKAQQIAENQDEQLTGLFKKNLKSNSPYRLELTGGSFLNLRGKILENLKEDTRVWVTGKIRTQLYLSPSPEAAMPTQWDIWMEVENFKEISEPFEIPIHD